MPKYCFLKAEKMMNWLSIVFVVAVAFFGNSPTLSADDPQANLAERDSFWAEVSRAVRAGDFEGYAATCHPNGVLVSGVKQTSEPLTQALKRWKPGIDDTKLGKMQASVEFRFSRRWGDETTAHETGIFLYSTTNAEGVQKDEYIHFEALLVKEILLEEAGTWKTIMEFQKSNATQEEWKALESEPAASAEPAETAASAGTGHRVLTQGNNKLALVAADGSLEWEMKWGATHDIHLLDTGNILIAKGSSTVVELDPETKQVVWEYDAAKRNGNAGKPVEIHAFQPLAENRILIAESGPARIIEIDRAGKLLSQIKLKVDHPHPHTDTRLVRKLNSGNYLVCHEGDGFVREYAASGDVAWEYEVPLFGKKKVNGHGPESFGNKLFCALRLENGNTLIATGNGHSVIEVTPKKEIVWKIEQHDLPNITLAWVTTLDVLKNGNYVIGNCHAGPNQPLLIEIDPATKSVVWQFDHFDTFGNSVSNSQILGPIKN